MPSGIEGENRQAVRRAVPKDNNKIIAGAIARLYVAYPDRRRWTYTGLQGAVVLANDLVGNTLWLKMVDISPSGRGIIWDQEIYENFQYNQDRVFFHTFELEGCLAGLSFTDDKEAAKFKERMDKREKHAHRNTRSKPFGNAAGQPSESSGKSHGILGGFGRSLLGHRSSSAQQQPQAQSIIPPKEVSIAPSSSPAPASTRSSGGLDNLDPKLLKELRDLGMTDEQLLENKDFIKMYIAQHKVDTSDDRRSRPPPPPQPLTPQDTGNTSSSGRRGPPPAPPPARRGGAARPPSPPPDKEEEPASPKGHHSSFKVPAFTGAGALASIKGFGSSPKRDRADSNAAASPTPGPPPPPRPPKTPLDEEQAASGGPQKFGVPPPFSGDRKPVPPNRGAVPPPPPSRNSGPPPPPARQSEEYDPYNYSSPQRSNPPPPPARETSTSAHSVPPAAVPPPPLPPKTPHAPSPAAERHLPPPPPTRDTRSVPPPPPPPPASNAGPPPPPPMPAKSSGPPPPPPMPSSSGGAPPPPPPPPPNMPAPADAVTANAPAVPKGGGRDNLMADIRGGARLKKLGDNEKNDRSAATVAGGAGGGSGGGGGASGGTPAPAGGDQGGLAGALASALAQRKAKVGDSDDDDDKDDW